MSFEDIILNFGKLGMDTFFLLQLLTFKIIISSLIDNENNGQLQLSFFLDLLKQRI